MNNYALQLISALSGAFGGLKSKTMPQPTGSGFKVGRGRPPKGQLRQAKPKSSGASQLKREAKKRNHIRKRK